MRISKKLGAGALAAGVALMSCQLLIGCGSSDDSSSGETGGTAGAGESGGTAGKGGTSSTAGKGGTSQAGSAGAEAGGMAGMSEGETGGHAGTAGISGALGGTGGGGAGGKGGASGSGGGGAGGKGGAGGTGGASGTGGGGASGTGGGGASGTGGGGASGSGGGGASGTGGGGASGSGGGGASGSGGGGASGSGGGGASGSGGGGASGSGGAAPVCGNGIVEAGELCDPAFTTENCGSDCKAITKASCTTCEDSLNKFGTAKCPAVACSLLSGTAVAGPAVGTALPLLCNETLDCVRDSGCAVGGASLFDCYCGTQDPTACGLAGGGNGPCKAQMQRSLETTDFQTVEQRISDPTFAGGQALSRVFCDQVSCDKVPSACF